jgi:UDP-glucose 4-epimerase
MTGHSQDGRVRGRDESVRGRSKVFGVTGVAGFIGSHLADFLVDRGHRVVGVDDLSGGSLENLAALRDDHRFSLLQGDLREDDVSEELVRGTDVVIHLAAVVGVGVTMSDPFRTLETNVGATMSLLGAARRAASPQGRRPAPRILIASTSEVYGKCDGLPVHEADDIVFGGPERTRWAYGAGKLVGEFMALAAHAQHDVPVVVARLFNTVGPRQSPRHGMVVPRMMEQAVQGAQITVYGTGEQTRCFCAVQDTVRALVGLAEEQRAVGGVFNVGGDREITIEELAAEVRDVAGSSSEIVYIPHDDVYGAAFDDVPRRRPDTRRVRSLLSWRPTVPLRQILLEVKNHVVRRLSAQAEEPPA